MQPTCWLLNCPFCGCCDSVWTNNWLSVEVKGCLSSSLVSFISSVWLHELSALSWGWWEKPSSILIIVIINLWQRKFSPKLYMNTCSCWPCLIQLSETLSSLLHKERSSIASRLVRRGPELIWTEVAKRLKSKDLWQRKDVCKSWQRWVRLAGLPLRVWFPMSSVGGAE